MANKHYYVDKDGVIRFNWHFGQRIVWESEKRFVIALCGRQVGKTVIGPPWMMREMKRRGPGEYLVVGPHAKLLERKVVREWCMYFETALGLGTYTDMTFRFNDKGEKFLHGDKADPLNPTIVYFGHAKNPELLESITALAVWMDEPGQESFKQESMQAIEGRTSTTGGRILMTTTPYNFGWLKKDYVDEWKSAPELPPHIEYVLKEGLLEKYVIERHDHPDIDVVRFESRLNPAFTRAEWERFHNYYSRVNQMWKFDMFYRAIFTRPAGQIFSAFDEKRHVVDRFSLSHEWERYLGLDLGGVHTAGVFSALVPPELHDHPANAPLPPSQHFFYRTYKNYEGGKSIKQRVKELRVGEPAKITAAGGSLSEDQWRIEYAQAGLQLLPPLFREVDVGNAAVNDAFASDRYVIFRDQTELIEQVIEYAYELDDDGNPTEKIANKSSQHLADALRYHAVRFARARRSGSLPEHNLGATRSQPSWMDESDGRFAGYTEVERPDGTMQKIWIPSPFFDEDEAA
jgi:hypothetical protein